jgi:hypothetical protein
MIILDAKEAGPFIERACFFVVESTLAGNLPAF